ncbi:unnamed protein product [Lampetra planeri]
MGPDVGRCLTKSAADEKPPTDSEKKQERAAWCGFIRGLETLARSPRRVVTSDPRQAGRGGAVRARPSRAPPPSAHPLSSSICERLFPVSGRVRYARAAFGGSKHLALLTPEGSFEDL